jgi:hypothetical protein
VCHLGRNPFCIAIYVMCGNLFTLCILGWRLTCVRQPVGVLVASGACQCAWYWPVLLKLKLHSHACIGLFAW